MFSVVSPRGLREGVHLGCGRGVGLGRRGAGLGRGSGGASRAVPRAPGKQGLRRLLSKGAGRRPTGLPARGSLRVQGRRGLGFGARRALSFRGAGNCAINPHRAAAADEP
ncbi:hypothetical protein SBD_3296 [Streptomyces bottropensis ATCC 25435]|uniref:Uncharacterized protein n=1 Tax=Streptomyces bottropensis ATCC 25435 TaxID=1054862 RepID=M3FUT3_9ACTN|nr:hypothetical protein SBD_3296 [Streptomyces bottropensis ATCC 25435]